MMSKFDAVSRIRVYLDEDQVVPGEMRHAIHRVLARHTAWPVYEPCGHQHTHGEPGVVMVDDIGYVCEDGRVSTVCRECCTDNDYQTEQCAEDHVVDMGEREHGCWPCPTVRDIASGLAVAL